VVSGNLARVWRQQTSAATAALIAQRAAQNGIAAKTDNGHRSVKINMRRGQRQHNWRGARLVARRLLIIAIA